MNDFQMYEEGRKKAEAKRCDIHVGSESCTINGKELCEYSDKLGFCPRCDTDAYSR